MNTSYDIESVKVGDTCRILNYDRTNSYFNNNMMIVGIVYQGDTISIEVEDTEQGFGRVLQSFVDSNAGSTSSSGGGGGGSGPGFVDRESPSGSVNGSNVTFTVSQTPVTGSEYVYVDGILQNAGGGNDYTISSATITFNSAPLSGSVILVSYRTANGSINFVDRETPSGTVNGSNTNFTLAHTPTTGSEHVWVDGILQNAGSNDYSISGTTISFVTAPASGSVILVSYRY